MTKKKSFEALMEEAANGGVFVRIPFDAEEYFGKKRVKIKATIDGTLYLGSLVRMGGPDHLLLIRKDIRAKIGKQAGDRVKVTVEEDVEPRVVEVPSDLEKALKANSEAEAFFLNLSYTHQKEYVQWIEEARREETRLGRVEKTIGFLKEGKKTK